MGIITWIVLGLVAGVVANFIASGGFGLIVASAIFNASDVTGINLYSIVVSVLGAIAVIAIARLITQRRSGANV